MNQNEKIISIKSRPRVESEYKYDCGKNIEQARLKRGITRPELARLMGMTLGGVSSWEYGRTRPDIQSLKRLCEILGSTSDELLGIKQKQDLMNERETSLIDAFRRLPENEKRYAEGIIKLMSEEKYQTPKPSIVKPKLKPKLISLPLNALSMCAGDGFDLDDGGESEYVQLIDCELTDACDELVRVSGCSMEPEFYDGDLALVKHTESLSEGDIGVFVIDGEGMIKQYQKDGLHPLNKKYDVVRPGAYSSFRCFGKVIGKVTDEMLP